MDAKLDVLNLGLISEDSWFIEFTKIVEYLYILSKSVPLPF